MRALKILMFLIIISNKLFSQKATVRGFVYDEKTGEPVIFTNVYLKGTTYGASTDVNGYFSISGIPAGNYVLTITYIGYDTLSEKISLKEGQVLNKNLYLKKGGIQLKTVEISAEKQEMLTEVKVSVTKITPKDIKKIPTIGAEPDLAQYLQVLPGVIFTGDQGGQLYIRGGSPIQNKLLLDGMIVYNPFHSIGLFSVLDADIIRNADIYTGAFGAQYGGRISSIMDITTRDGNKTLIAGKLSVNPFVTKSMIEGPIKKFKANEGGHSSFILSAKGSYLEQSSKIFYKYVSDSLGLPYNFLDLYGKVSFNAKNGSKVSFFAFNYNDKVNFQPISLFNWKAIGAGSKFILVPGQSPVLIEGTFAYSSYKMNLTEEKNAKPRTSSINGFNFNLDFTNFQKANELRYGIEGVGFSTNFQFYNSVNSLIKQEDNTSELNSYVTYRWNKGKFIIQPGLRLQYYASLSIFSSEPRLGIKFNAFNNLRFKLATGMYSQNLISATSDKDIVNLFYGFLSSTTNIPDKFQKKYNILRKDTVEVDIKNSLQKANHLVAGVEYDLNNNITINIETYYKKFTQLTNINKNKLFEDNAENADIADSLKKDFIIETGDAYGLDFSLKYEHKNIFLWFVYSLGKVIRWDGSTTYFPVFDRRHNINLLASYTFGKDLNWETSVRWNLGSGFPFYPTQGFYEKLVFENIDENYVSSNGNLGIVFANEQKRLPFYHRLDFNLKRKFFISENSEIDAVLSVTNVYNRKNLFYINRITVEPIYQLPILPSIGITWLF